MYKMDSESLKQYIGKVVKLTISTGYYFKGKVIDVTEQSFSLIDIKNKNVTLMPESIMMIEEADK